jgi:hypothetical protein
VPANTFRFIPAAERELDEAAHWYEERRQGLGLEFLTVVREKVFALMDAPGRWRWSMALGAPCSKASHLLSFTARFPMMRSKSSQSRICVASRSIGQIDSWLPNIGLKQTRISLRSTRAA